MQKKNEQRKKRRLITQMWIMKTILDRNIFAYIISDFILFLSNKKKLPRFFFLYMLID